MLKERNIGFDDVIFALQAGNLLDDGPHPVMKVEYRLDKTESDLLAAYEADKY